MVFLNNNSSQLNPQVPQTNSFPLGQENLQYNPHQNNPDIFQAIDGSLFSFSQGKMIRDNTKNIDSPNSKLRIIKDPYSNYQEWNDSEIMSLDIKHQKEIQAGLSRTDIEYAELSKIENDKLVKNMIDLQKQMLNDLENGKWFKTTKLIDD